MPGGGDSDLDPDDTINGGDTLVEEEEKDTGVVKLHVYKAYWHAVGSCLALMVLLSLWFMQGIYNERETVTYLRSNPGQIASLMSIKKEKLRLT